MSSLPNNIFKKPENVVFFRNKKDKDGVAILVVLEDLFSLETKEIKLFNLLNP